MKRKNFFVYLFVFAFIFVLLGSWSLCVGAMDLSLGDVLSSLLGKTQDTPKDIAIWEIRLPRFLTGAIMGMALSLAGCAMQTLFGNPLADPSLTGVSSGAALGGAICICVFSLTGFYMQISALALGILTSFFIWKAGKFCGKLSAYSMLLAGIAINAFCAALIGFLMYSAREEGVRGFIFWSLGSLELASWNAIICSGLLTFVIFVAFMYFSPELNMLFLGEENAYYSGANLKRVQIVAMLGSALLTGAAVSICGIVGFVGLVVPHIVRQLTSADNRFLMPISALMGASLITACDILGRVISPDQNIPIGIMTALIGSPFFIFLILSKTRLKA